MPFNSTFGAGTIRGYGRYGGGKPQAPTIGTATRRSDGSVDVSFTAPAYNGGAAIFSYTATSSPGGITGTLNQPGSGTINVSGLTLGTSYTFTVFATNAYGNSPSSSASNAVVAASIPGTPTIGTASVVDGTTVNVSYTAPASNGGATITSYTATSSPGGITGTRNAAGSGTITVSGLTAGTSYTFRVFATNDVGNSPQSSSSNSVTPRSWSVTRNRTSIGEVSTQTVTFTVTTEGVSTGTYYYQMVGSNVTSADFSSGWNGSFTLSGSLASASGSFSATATADSATEGTESFYASVRSGSVNGTEQASSGFVSISDQSTAPIPAGETFFFNQGGTWIVPSGVTVISVVAIGGGGTSGMNGNGGGGGGGLAYRNNLSVTAGDPYNYCGGNYNGSSFFRCCAYLWAEAGQSGSNSGGFQTGYGAGGRGGCFIGDGGGCGGRGGDGFWTYAGGGGGGAGGYCGTGGAGGRASAYPTGSPAATLGSAGSGGGGGGGSGGVWNAGGYVLKSGGSGGGVSYSGIGSNGSGGSVCGGTGVGGGGSGGNAGQIVGTGTSPSDRMCFTGGRYGGGQGSSGGDGWYESTPTPNNQVGVVRIIWPGTGGSSRTFPTNAA